MESPNAIENKYINVLANNECAQQNIKMNRAENTNTHTQV